MLRVQVRRITHPRPLESPALPADLLANTAQAPTVYAGIRRPYLPGGMIALEFPLSMFLTL